VAVGLALAVPNGTAGAVPGSGHALPATASLHSSRVSASAQPTLTSGPSMRFHPVPGMAGEVPGLGTHPAVRLPAAVLDRTRAAAPLRGLTPGADLVLGKGQSMLIDTNASLGNLTLTGNATLVVENSSHPVTLTIGGNVNLYNRSILFLNRSNLVANESYDNQLTFFAWNSSRFLVVGANVTANGHQWIAGFYDNTNLTVVGSYFGYPSSWVPLTIANNASVYVAFSWFLSDVVMQDAPALRSTAHLTMERVAGFNLWLGVAAFAWINLSVPAPDTVQTWQFPGPYNVSGVNYTVSVADSLVGVHVFTVWKASHLVVTDSPGVVIALNPINDVLVLAGFTEGWQNSSYHQGGFDLRVYDSRVESWNFYPTNTVATILNSQFGEILAEESSSVTVENSTLTGHGGYYGAFGNGSLTVSNSTISAQIIGYGTGKVRLDNCSDATPAPVQILAAQGSTIVSVNTALGTNVTYGATDQGRVDVEATLTLATTVDRTPRADVAGFVGPMTGRSLSPLGATGVNGTLLAQLPYESVRANGTDWLGGYDVAAVWGADIAEATVNLTGPTTLDLDLVPAVVSVSPTNNTAGVGGSLDVGLQFAVPMNPSLPVDLLGRGNQTTSWSGPTTATVALSGLLPGSAYEVKIPPGAMTAWGVRLVGPYWYNFSTAAGAPATPVLLAAVPANETEYVSVWTNISLRFSAPMDAASTEAAFSVVPAVLGGMVTVSGEWLNWSHAAPLAPQTSYTIVVGPGARGLGGGSFQSPATFSFETGNPTPAAPPHAPVSSGGSGMALLAVAILVAAAAVVGVVLWRSRRPPPPLPWVPPPVWME